MDPSRAAAALARLNEESQEHFLGLLPQARAKELRELKAYESDTAGGLMDPRVTMFRPNSTVRDALNRLRILKQQRIHDVFVVDPDGRLVGSATLQDLAIADPRDQLDSFTRPTSSVQATASKSEVVEVLGQRKTASLAVVDFEGRLIGVIRHGALVTAAHEEATVDLQTMVGASRDERALSPIPFAVRKRLPWLHINLATAFLAASVVGIFEGTIARFTALAVLLPVVAGQSGNTGAQALAVTMRGLALREVRLRHYIRIAFKEVSVGAFNGIAIGVVTALGVFVWSQSLGLATVIGSAMIVSMIVAGLAGASVPMVLTSLGQDPAQASSIILTTVTDIVGFLSFLGLATLAASFL
jgi:magnesium transporter